MAGVDIVSHTTNFPLSFSVAWLRFFLCCIVGAFLVAWASSIYPSFSHHLYVSISSLLEVLLERYLSVCAFGLVAHVCSWGMLGS